jgi:hypothetical protein
MTRSLFFGLTIPAFFFTPASALAQEALAEAPIDQARAPMGEPGARAAEPAPPMADAPAPSANASDRPGRVHDGFYLSASAGGGARSMRINSSQDITVDGTGGAFGVRIGGAIARNLFLHATAQTSVTQDPEISIGSMTVTANRAGVTFTGIGPGLSYYFMPANVSLGGSVLVTQARFELDGEVAAKSEWGPGLELRVGKEFWVSNDLLLGIGLSGMGSVMSDQNTTDTIIAQAFNLTFDLTYD